MQDNVLKYHCRAAFEPDFFFTKYSKQTNFKTKKIQTTQDGMSNGLFVVGTPCQGLNYWAESQTPAPSPQWDHPVARTTFCIYNFLYLQLCNKVTSWNKRVVSILLLNWIVKWLWQRFLRTNWTAKYQRTRFECSTSKGIEKSDVELWSTLL